MDTAPGRVDCSRPVYQHADQSQPQLTFYSDYLYLLRHLGF